MSFSIKHVLMALAIIPTLAFAQSSKIVAVVAGEPITEGQVQEKVRVNSELAKQIGQKIEASKLLEASKEELIMDKILMRKATSAGLVPNKDQISKAVAEIAKINQMTSEQFKDNIIKKDGKQAYDNFLNDLKTDIAISKLEEKEVMAKMSKPSASEVSAFIEKVKQTPNNPLVEKDLVEARHIFVAIDSGQSKSKAMAKIKDIQAKLKRGENFAEIAKKESENKYTASQGGLIPIIDLNDSTVDPAILKVAKNASEQLVNDPIVTKNGVHIFEFGKRQKVKPTDEEAKAWAVEQIQASKVQSEMANWLEKVKQESKSIVEYRN